MTVQATEQVEDDAQLEVGRWTCEGCGYEEHDVPMPLDMAAFKKNQAVRQARLGGNGGYACHCCRTFNFIPNET